MAKTDRLKRPDPAYMLYTSDFLVRTQYMTDEQVGKFIRLLCYQHQTGHIDEAHMLSFCKGRDEAVFAKFLQDDKGLYYNEEMDNEVKRRTGVRQRKSHPGPEKIEEQAEEDSGFPF